MKYRPFQEYMFKRKIYEKLLEWKNEYAGSYACLIEGPDVSAKAQS